MEDENPGFPGMGPFETIDICKLGSGELAKSTRLLRHVKKKQNKYRRTESDVHSVTAGPNSDNEN